MNFYQNNQLHINETLLSMEAVDRNVDVDVDEIERLFDEKKYKEIVTKYEHNDYPFLTFIEDTAELGWKIMHHDDEKVAIYSDAQNEFRYQVLSLEKFCFDLLNLTLDLSEIGESEYPSYTHWIICCIENRTSTMYSPYRDEMRQFDIDILTKHFTQF